MSNAKLKSNIKQLQNWSKEIKKAKRSTIKIGLPEEKSSSIVYGGGNNIISIGLIHEYGNSRVPRRSWLRNSMNVNESDINKFLQKAFKSVFEKRNNTKKALGLSGVYINSFVVKGFKNNGYGTWAELSDVTVKRKKSAVALTATGLLKQSVTWIVV